MTQLRGAVMQRKSRRFEAWVLSPSDQFHFDSKCL